MKCVVEIRKDLYAKVVWSDGVAMFHGIDEQMAKNCNVSYANDLLVSVTVSVKVSLGTKLAQLRGSVRMHTDRSLLQSCTCVSLVTDLLCALDHTSNAFALAQIAPQNGLPFDTLSIFLVLFPGFLSLLSL